MNKTNSSVSDLPTIITDPLYDGTVRLVNFGLTSLDGCPNVIPGRFEVRGNQLNSLFGGPSIVGDLYDASYNHIKSLDFLPTKIGGGFNLDSNRLVSLQGINKLKEMDGVIRIRDMNITSHILGVFFIKGCAGLMIRESKHVSSLTKAVNMVNDFILSGRGGLLPCQKALIEAGLHDYAQM
jgi:hypothetical protein